MNRLSRWVEPYIGRQFEHANPCWELVRQVFWDRFRIQLEEHGECINSDDRELIERVWAGERAEPHWVRVKGQPRDCDVLDLVILGRPHVALFVNPGFLLHTSVPENTVRVEPLGRRVEVRCVKGYYRHTRLMPH